MNLKVKFHESESSFKASFGESEQKINTSFSGTTFIRGDDGKDGTTFIPSVSDDGVITWENDGGLPNPPPVNIKGRDGKEGQNGKDGYSPVRGKDYWTDADRAAMVSDVIAALPVYNGEVVSV